MDISYADEELRLLIETGCSNHKLYKKFKSNATIMNDLMDVVGIIRNAKDTRTLELFRRLNYKSLHGDLKGFNSIRIGYKSKYRLIVKEIDGGIKLHLIEINEHYGDK